MRSSFLLTDWNFITLYEVKGVESQSLLNEVKYSNEISKEKEVTICYVAIPFKWGQVFQRIVFFSPSLLQLNLSQSLLNEVKFPTERPCVMLQGEFSSQSLLNEVKYSNWSFPRIYLNFVARSQSLLNEVKYSNFKRSNDIIYPGFIVAIPFKWGQVFQQNPRI